MATHQTITSPWQLTKQLIINRLEMQHRMTGKYTLGLCAFDNYHSQEEATLTLTATDLIRYRLDPQEGLVGANVELTLLAVPHEPARRQPDIVTIEQLSAERITRYATGGHPPEKMEVQLHRLQLTTPVSRGRMVLLPDTYLKLNLTLTEDDYRHVQELPAGTAFQVALRCVKPPFRDFSLTWRGVLDAPRILPADYSARMIALVRAMIALFDGDVDVLCHACGLETHEKETTDDTEDTWPSIRRWQRETFAVDVYEPDAWEKPYAERMVAVEAVLAERYGNQLVSGGPSVFYDLLEASTWQSQRRHPVDEVTVGLRTGNVMHDGLYLPSIVIEARSVGGNRKGCEAICTTVAQEATRLFGVKFDQWAVADDGVLEQRQGKPEVKHIADNDH